MKLGQNFVIYFFRFLGNGVSRKKAFKIYWPLVGDKSGNNDKIVKILLNKRNHIKEFPSIYYVKNYMGGGGFRIPKELLV